MTEPWTEKYRPKNPSEMMGNEVLVNVLRSFLKGAFDEIERVFDENDRIRQVDGKKKQKRAKPNTKKISLLLSGPPGIGKTTAVIALCRSLGISVMEMNASDERTVKKLRRLIVPAIEQKGIASFFKDGTERTVILLDEADGMNGTVERGGIREVINIIGVTTCPIILIANEWKAELKPIYAACSEYKVPVPSSEAIMKTLDIISRSEKLGIPMNVLGRIAAASAGDFRAAINDLQAMNPSSRDFSGDIFASLRKFYGAKDPAVAEKILKSFGTDVKYFLALVFENMIPRIASGKQLRAFRTMASVDLIMGRILERQEWSMFPQLIEILKNVPAHMNDNGGTFSMPKYHASRTDDAEALMGMFLISREEARILKLLADRIRDS